MSNHFDGFDDVVGGSAGIFDGSTTSIAGTQGGLSSFDSPTTTPRADGVAVGMQCRGCGKPVELVVEYPELVCVKYGISPHPVMNAFPALRGQVAAVTQWQYSAANQGWAPMQICQHCHTWLPPIFTPEEADRLLNKARRNGWINIQAEKVISNAAYEAANAQAKANLQR